MIEPLELAKKIEELLNSSTTKKKKFKVFYFINYFDRKSEIETDDDFTTVIMTNPEGTYKPLKNKKICDQSFLLQIVFPVNEKDEILSEVSSFIELLIGQIYIFENLKCVFNCDVPSLAPLDHASMEQANNQDGRFSLKEDFYSLCSIRVYMTITNFGIFGNEVEYLLSEDGVTFEDLVSCDAAVNLNKDTKSSQFIKESQSLSIVNSIASVKTNSFYFNPASPIQIGMLHDAVKGENGNKIYWMKKNYKDGANLIFSYTQKVIITNITFGESLNKLITIDLAFAPALDLEE